MKTNYTSLLRLPLIAVAAMVSLTGFPTAADAKPKQHKSKNHSHSESKNYSRSERENYSHSGSHYDRDDRGRSYYHSIPRSRFSLTLGTGYAGSGYYYGPPGVPYYYERPDVRYYRYSHQVPRSYGEGSYGAYGGGGTAVAVQRALSRQGYYSGPIDGDIGSGSRRAIARYQAANGLGVTGNVDRALLYSLGLG